MFGVVLFLVWWMSLGGMDMVWVCFLVVERSLGVVLVCFRVMILLSGFSYLGMKMVLSVCFWVMCFIGVWILSCLR